jgi:hypothetical protein
MGKASALAVGAVMLLIDPLFACRAPTTPFRFGEAEVRAAIEGTWVVHMPPDHATRTVVLAIGMQRAATPARVACSRRTMIRSAHACGDSTEVKIEVAALFNRTPITGTFHAHGLDFGGGDLVLQIDDAMVHARIDEHGEAERVLVYRDDRRDPATMQRIAVR